jgi:hypothetical protein
VWRKAVTESKDATVEYVIQPIPEADAEDRFIPHFTIHARRGDYTSGPFVWVTTEAEGQRVARALRRDDEHYDALIPETGRVAATEAVRRGWPHEG